MLVGIPKGLLYYKYYPFCQRFFTELGAEIIVSPDTNKEILNDGIKYCVDEACLPVKIFHGHVSYLKDKCDVILLPRIMQIRKKEYICPKFCGLPEMITNSIPNINNTIDEPIYATSKKKLYNWAKKVGKIQTRDNFRIKKAFDNALNEQENSKIGIKDVEHDIKVALIGHPYNIYDKFSNMNIVKKLNNLGVGTITEENIDGTLISEETKTLFKRPFWTFASNSYGFATYGVKEKCFNGIIYISSFACGIDSVVIELIKDRIGDFPFMILKIDEHTGEAGLDTRIEALIDMLERSY